MGTYQSYFELLFLVVQSLVKILECNSIVDRYQTNMRTNLVLKFTKFLFFLIVRRAFPCRFYYVTFKITVFVASLILVWRRNNSINSVPCYTDINKIKPSNILLGRKILINKIYLRQVLMIIISFYSRFQNVGFLVPYVSCTDNQMLLCLMLSVEIIKIRHILL